MPDRRQDGVLDGDQGLEFADASGQAPVAGAQEGGVLGAVGCHRGNTEGAGEPMVVVCRSLARTPPGSSRSGSHVSYPQPMAYMGNTLFGQPRRVPTRTSIYVTNGFRPVPSSTGASPNPIARKLPLGRAAPGRSGLFSPLRRTSARSVSYTHLR